MAELFSPLLVNREKTQKMIRSNLVKTSRVHGSVTWVSMGIIGVAAILMVIFLIKMRK
jgi:hypothetical protein